MATSTVNTNKPIIPRGVDDRPVDKYNRAELYSGKALDFDGVNDNVNLDGFTMSGNNYSFAFCLKADAWNNFDYIFDIHPNRFIIASQPANNLAIYDGNSWQVFGEINDTTNTNFFTITIEGTISKAYLNGVQFGSTLNIASRDFSNATKCALMMAYDGTGLFFPGKMSGFKAFDVALTAAQVADLYNNPEKVVPTGVSDSALKLWLPMMEGAGTTAYDGSGNGNHGTISGATYVNGVGAPVSQTALIDWNKGTNLVAYSTDLEGYWSLNGATWTSGQDDPIGGTDAYKMTSTGGDPWLFKNATTAISGTQYTAKCWVKGAVGREARLWIVRDNVNFEREDFTLTGDWQQIETTKTFPTTPVSFVSFRLDIPDDSPVSGDVGYIFAPRLVAGDNADVYIPTLSTAQTSPVLLPQGLTSGRDITGVNLFENVRKQGALNLDGNSWAEVHDNASLDFGTGSFTLEAWVKAKYINQGSVFNMIISLGGNITSSNNAGLMLLNNNVPYFIYSNPGASSGSAQTEGDWIHIVGTYDETNTTIYVNGSQADQDARTAVDITNGFTKFIGRDGTDPNRYYHDQIAQPRIYNRALTASEVLNNYNATSSLYI